MVNKQLNIIMLGHKSIPSRDGGIEVVVEEIATRMVKLGHRVTCINRSLDDKGNNKIFKGVEIKSVPTINVRGLAAMSSSFFGALKASFSKCDVVHFHAEGPSFTCFLPKFFHKKVIVTIHGLDWQRSKWGKFASWYIKKGEENAVKYADEIIVLSKNMQKYFKEKYDRDTNYIPNGVNKPTLREANIIKERWNLNKDDYILFLGRLVPEKGVHYLIDAYKKIKTNKKLVIAGGSSDSNEYVNILRKNENNNIIFTGKVDGSILDELFSNAYIYCLPSDIEGMPLSLLEAMSYGNCCIVSDIKECCEVVEDKAILFSKGNVDDLERKIRYLLYNKNIVNNYKKNSASFVCGKYNWYDVTTKTIDVYNKH